MRRCRRRTAHEVVLSEVERAQLEHIVACDTRAHHEVQRAKLVLMAAEGLSNAEIGRRRLIQTGAVPITWAAMVAEPQRDWAREQPLPGVAQLQAQPCGGSGIAFPWETQLLATPGPGVGAPARRSPTDPNRQRRGPTPGAPPPARRSDSLRERQSEPRSRRRSSWTTSSSAGPRPAGYCSVCDGERVRVPPQAPLSRLLQDRHVVAKANVLLSPLRESSPMNAPGTCSARKARRGARFPARTLARPVATGALAADDARESVPSSSSYPTCARRASVSATASANFRPDH
jgi:hypothetical protein